MMTVISARDKSFRLETRRSTSRLFFAFYYSLIVGLTPAPAPSSFEEAILLLLEAKHSNLLR